ncbi:MAG: hypothetical protein DMF21_07945 [Verrucomicrobia bacterium]|nr:MAG: hypothetical protein DMF21_07945 [Verrucomicrobiota bacterium]
MALELVWVCLSFIFVNFSLQTLDNLASRHHEPMRLLDSWHAHARKIPLDGPGRLVCASD